MISTKSKSGTPIIPEVRDKIGGPSRTRTLDPLIKSEDPERCKSRDENESARTYDYAADREHRLRADESPHVGPIWNQIHLSDFVSHDIALV